MQTAQDTAAPLRPAGLDRRQAPTSRCPRAGRHRLDLRALVLAAAPTAGCSDWGIFSREEPAPDPVVVEEVFVQAPLPQVDVLWVVDDTASMGEEQAALGDAFGSFVDELDLLALAWQVGVVTTEGSGDMAGVLQGNPWIIHPDLEDPAGAFELAIDVGTAGAGPEAALGAAWLALSEPLVAGDNRGFRRPGAALHVVVVSDADDASQGVLGDDPATTFLAFLDQQAEATGAGAVLSAVVGTSADACDSAVPAETTIAVALASGGTVQSICAADLAPVAAAIGQAGITWPTTFPLQATPVADSAVVRVDGVRQDEGWTVEIDARLLRFDVAPPPAATILISYELAEEGGA